MFCPRPKGWMNPAMKDISVREVSNDETKLFDHAIDFSSRSELPPAASVLLDSIVVLRDLHYFFSNDCMKNPITDLSISYALDGFNYYIERMHSTDSDSLKKKIKQLFFEGVPFRDILRIICLCTESMCKINVAMIQMSFRSVDGASQKTIEIQARK